MRLLERAWAAVVYALELVSLSTWHDSPLPQQPLHGLAPWHGYTNEKPIFTPIGADPDFECDYTAMGPDWTSCTQAWDRSCWLVNTKTHERYDLYTDYERRAPTGVMRNYTIDAAFANISADGFIFQNASLFNERFPGPWLQACWGDQLNITVRNYLPWNGTTIHWHGIRQLHSVDMDGVNGVTQCPIAPGKHFSYIFNATQYGTSWYHSHYSLQYADGLLGPMTFYGPSSANYDEAVPPILFGDWNHRSAFADFYKEISPGAGPPQMTSIILNGKGQYNCTGFELGNKTCVQKGPSEMYHLNVTAGKRYLLRLINHSVATTFIFAIDDHNVTVMTSDFVPIKPYNTSSVLVGIGQRYHVVFEAKPLTRAAKGKFWIRTIPALGCSNFANPQPANTTGILTYGDGDWSKLPDTKNGSYPTACSDEDYINLVPVIPWSVGPPSNEQQPNTFQVGLTSEGFNNSKPPGLPGEFSRWAMGDQPMWINFSNPTVMNLGISRPSWEPNLVIVNENNTNRYNDDTWIYLLITSTSFPFGSKGHNFVPAAHPIHLHGHDFAILQQSDKPYWAGMLDLKLDNPPRRDVALLPSNGYLMLGFKTDNPGTWIVHCHIAWHASAGLALQVLERYNEIVVPPERIQALNQTCNEWKVWSRNKTHWWNNTSPDYQDDSGV